MNNRRGVAATIVVLSLCASSALGGDRSLLVASPAGAGVMRFDHPSGTGSARSSTDFPARTT